MYKFPLSPDLLQGDVIPDFLHPIFSNAAYRLSKSARQPEFSATVTVKYEHIAIVSHSCDLVVHQKGPKRPAILFCPLIRVPDYIRSDEQRYAILRQNWVDTQHPHFISLYYFQKQNFLAEDMVIDFSTIQPLPVTQIELLRSKKALELDDDHRSLLKTKLMYHFGREE